MPYFSIRRVILLHSGSCHFPQRIWRLFPYPQMRADSRVSGVLPPPFLLCRPYPILSHSSHFARTISINSFVICPPVRSGPRCAVPDSVQNLFIFSPKLVKYIRVLLRCRNVCLLFTYVYYTTNSLFPQSDYMLFRCGVAIFPHR